MNIDQEQALDSDSAVDLVVALYDAILGFLNAALVAVECGDTEARRVAVKRALDTVIHLQARLRMDVGGRTAQALSEFYASIFTEILQASQSASQPKFEHAIECVENVRDVWRQVAREPVVSPTPIQVNGMNHGLRQTGFDGSDYGSEASAGSSWIA